MTAKMNEKEMLTPEVLDHIAGGYIIKDEAGYHAIGDNDGIEIHCFKPEEYDLMMKLFRQWKFSTDYITWEDADRILQKYREDNNLFVDL